MSKFDEVICQENSQTSPQLYKRHDTMRLLSLYLGSQISNQDSFKIKPSLYIREMLLSTDERLEQLSKVTRQSFKTGVKREQIDFKITPPVVVFQSFMPGKQYNTTLTLCNTSKVSKKLAVRSKSSHIFSVSYLSKVCSKLAPGMSLYFLIKFCPQLDQDYSYSVSLETENYSFNIPIIALGSRPIVNFPDSLNLGETFVKLPCSKSFYVKNIGQVIAVFNLFCQRPFSVQPEKCILDVGACTKIIVTFETTELNDFFQKMFIRYETGEELFMELTASSKNGNIWLDCNKVCFGNTFMTLQRQQKVTLKNDSLALVKFVWLKFETAKEDFEQLERLEDELNNLNFQKTVHCNKQEDTDIIFEDRAYTKINDDNNLLSRSELKFFDHNFEISPMKGEIWPGGRCEVTVTFKPQTAGELSASSFCDVTANSSRLSLHMSGSGQGPLIKLSFRSLDIGFVYLDSHQHYEVIAANKGDINGRLLHIPTRTIFGGIINCDPGTHNLKPYEMKSFVISFSSNRSGQFIEDILFKIVESGEEIKLTLKGNVVNPTISFDPTKLNFGIVPVGFPKTQSVNLVNQSQVPVTFALRVCGDGNIPPILCTEFAEASVKPTLTSYCREFTIFPNCGVIQPNSSSPIEITLVTNNVRKNTSTLIAENENIPMFESVVLTLHYESRAPNIVCHPPELILRFSYIHHKYTQQFIVENKSDLPAYFCLHSQQSDLSPLHYTTDISEKLLDPWERVQITATITPFVMGRSKTTIKSIVFGINGLCDICSIFCTAQGPTVCSDVEELNFGNMVLLESKKLNFNLTNDSPIDATFAISVEEMQQCKIVVEPNNGCLQPRDVLTINVTLMILDPGNVSSSLMLAVKHGQTIVIGISASGSGCGIAIKPNIFPEINLGYLFSRRLYQFPLDLFNPGSKHHLIQFIPEKMNVKSNLAQQNLFQFIPKKFELAEGGVVQVILEGQSNSVTDVKEKYSCWALINKKGLKQHIGDILIQASFVAPMVELSENSLVFDITIDASEDQGKICTRTLALKSVARLPVTMVLELNLPFILIEDNGEIFNESLIRLDPEEETNIMLGFKPPIQSNLECATYRDVLTIRYQEHPQKDEVILNGKLHFPNIELSLHVLTFGCIPLDSEDNKEVVMVNSTPLPLKYSFSWDPESITIAYFEHEDIDDIVSSTVLMDRKESAGGSLPFVYIEPLPVKSSLNSILRETQAEDKEIKLMHEALCPSVKQYFKPENPTPEFNILLEEKPLMPIVSQVFDLTPVFGTLAPFQSQILNIAFRPRTFMGVAASAICTVEGGPSVSLHMSGQSARHIFSISTTLIDFGFRVFTETCEEVIKLSNMSQLPFHFKVLSNCTPPATMGMDDVEFGKIVVEPSFGHVNSQSTAAISVRFFPGLAGEFQQQFTIQIDYLEPVPVLVLGHGVLPQVTLNQPRVPRPNIPITCMYSAVASLTSQRFSPWTNGQITSNTNDDLLRDWVVIEYSDIFPANNDIWLAIERLIAYNFIKDNPMSFCEHESGHKPIPKLLVPGYVLDLGYIVIGTTTEVTVMVENNGFVQADLHFSTNILEKVLKQDGFYITFKNHIGLPVGQTVPLYITIKPTFKRYSDKEQLINFIIQLQIVHGATIPIYTKALLTVPYIYVDLNVVNFGYVQCGYCVKKSILLQNCGAIEANWTGRVLSGKKRKEQETPFFLSKTSSVFLPKTAELLIIGFTPGAEDCYEDILEISVKHNPQKLIVRLQGMGVEPKIKITPKTVQFGAYAPYSGKIEKSFTVTNICPFNIDLYFPSFDSDIIEEDQVLYILANLYHCDNYLLPLELYNAKPSTELKQFCQNILEEAQAVITHSCKSSHLTEVSAEYFTSVSSKNTKSLSFSIKEPSSFQESTYLSSSEVGDNRTQSLHSENKSFFGIDSNLIETIRTFQTTDVMYDPLGLKEKIMPVSKCEEKCANKGILIVCHGAPQTESLYWANRMGCLMSLSVSTLDKIIVQEAVSSSKTVAIQVQTAINDAYRELAFNQEFGEEIDYNGPVMDFQELYKRVELLSNHVESEIMHKKYSGSKKKSPKAAASKPSTANKIEISPTFMNIEVDVFIELIKDRFLDEIKEGLILEKLTGFFLKTVSTAVNVILRCAGQTRCLEFISFYNTLEQYMFWKQKCQFKQETKQKADGEKLLLLCENMTKEELESLSPEEILFFESTVVAERRKQLLLLKAKRAQTCSPPSLLPTMTEVSPKSKKKSASKKLSKSEEKATKAKSSLNESTSSPKKKSGRSSSKVSTTKVSKLKEEEINKLKIAFSTYQSELEELVILLGRWNKELALFEDFDRPPSLFKLAMLSSNEKKKKQPSPQKPEDTNIAESLDVGVPCYIVKFPRNPQKVWFDELITYLLSTDIFITSKKTKKEWNDISIPEPLTLASISKPNIRFQNEKLESFYILDDKPRESYHSNIKIEESITSAEQSVKDLQQNSQETYEPAREVISSFTKDDEDSKMSAKSSLETSNWVSKLSSKLESDGEHIGDAGSGDCKVFTTRVTLAPREQKTWRVVFNPESVAEFYQSILLEIGGWRKKYSVHVEATCDIPCIDSNPSAMFEKTNETLNTSTISHCVYLVDEKLFYFGAVFASPANEFRSYDVTTYFYFTNISAVEVDISFELLNKQNEADSPFGFKPERLLILPGETKALQVWASPVSIGKYDETLMYSILNNPEHGFIEVSCVGILPEFEFEPKAVIFNRVLLYRKEICTLILKNKSYKPVGWKLIDLPQLGDQVSVSKHSGVIPALETYEVYIHFSAERIEVANHTIYLEVYDDRFRGPPLFSEPIQFVLESIDVLVDIIFPHAKSPELKFEKLKVGEPETQSIILKNKGNYDVTFKITFNKKGKIGFNPEKVFSFSPKTGILPKLEKPVLIKVICLCPRPVRLNKESLLEILLVDTAPQPQPVAAIPVSVTIVAFMSQYKVIPESELHFGVMLVGDKKVEKIIVENNGKFDFKFQVMSMNQPAIDELQVNLQPKKPSKSMKSLITRSSKTKKESLGKKGRTIQKDELWPSLSVGMFTLSHSGGYVPPGSSFTIEVECDAQAEEIPTEEIEIKLMEYPWTKKKGTCIKLIAAACLPCLNLDNVDEIFKEAYASSVALLNQGEAYIVFEKENNILRFCNVCVGDKTNHSLNLHLSNIGLVLCDVTANVVHHDKEPSVFQVEPNKLTIMPHSHSTISVSFHPTQIGMFTEQMEVKVQFPKPREEQVLTVTLVGEAHLPQILVTKPPPPHHLAFPPTLVGDCSEERLAFVNNGNISCMVIIEILCNEDPSFLFCPLIVTSIDSKEKDEAVVKRQSTWATRLRPGECYVMTVRFCPSHAAEHKCQVKLYITNNPYEDQTISVEGVGYSQDVTLMGLPLVHHNLRPSEQRVLDLMYKLEFGPCKVGEVAHQLFTLTNETQDKWYRFQWQDFDHITISPSIGHLPPESSKEILASFFTDEPNTTLDGIELGCSLGQIQLEDEKKTLTGWDNHQKTVCWVESSENINLPSTQRIFNTTEEPEFQEVPATNMSLSLLVSAIADFTKITCPTNAITFPPTIIHQVEEHNVMLSNIGIVPAVVSWQITDHSKTSLDDSVTTAFGVVSMSSEKPRLRIRKSVKSISRPYTCPHVTQTKRTSIQGPEKFLYRVNSETDFSITAPSVEHHHSWPIFVEPFQTTVLPGEQSIFVVKFQPTEVSNYICKLQLCVENTDPECDKVELQVEGSSLLPCCHLVVPGTKPTSHPSLLHINFVALGLGKPVTKYVSVVNTTSEDYTFYLKELTEEKISPFFCSTPFSLLNPAKHIEVTFSFIPTEVGTYQSTWELSIPERHVKQNVKLIAVATEPSITLQPTVLNLHPTLIGTRSEGSIYLFNNEDCGLKFSVDSNSLLCSRWGQYLQIQPMKGIIPAQTQIQLKVWVSPTQAGRGEFLVHLRVQLLRRPIIVNVIAECFLVQPLLAYQDLNKVNHQLVSDRSNPIDIGLVESHIPVTLLFMLTNVGKPAFHYHWQWDSNVMQQNHLSLSTANMSGLVGPQARVPLMLQLTTLTRTQFTSIKIQLFINKGPTFVILLSGSASQPLYKFSFNKFDFGPCFVQLSDNEYNQVNLLFINSDEKPLLIEEKSNDQTHFKIGITQSSVEPRSELAIPITFQPRACESYKNRLSFLVDGSHLHTVEVTGQGIDLNISLVNPSDKFISMEGVLVCKKKKAFLEIVNKSEKTVNPVFTLEPPVNEITLTPHQVKLKPKQTVDIVIIFSPKAHIKGIQQELCWSFQDAKRTLAVINAGSVGVSVNLDRDFISLGNTVVGNTATSKLLLSNVGDLAAKFSWEVKNESFKIIPAEGYVAPDSNIVLTVTFNPKRLETNMQCQAICSLTNHKALELKLCGSGINLPPSTMTIPLSCPVRQTISTQIPIFNKFSHDVTVKTEVSGEYFFGDQSSTIAAYGTQLFEVTYSPMTATSQVHKGIAVFYFIDGSCQVYSLEGMAGPPAAASRLEVNIPTHQPHSLSIPVHNWLQTSQKFHVTSNLESSSVAELRYQLSYNKFFMVSGSQKRDLLIHMVSYFPGTLTFKITLTNDTSGEYEWFEVVYEVHQCESVLNIPLSTIVRKPTTYNLEFYNPLTIPVSVDWVCQLPGLSVLNLPATVEPKQHVTLKLKYLPLWPSEHVQDYPLELRCTELGLFPYTVQASALPPPNEATLQVSCDFGFSTSTHLQLRNPTNENVVFECSSSNEDFTVVSSVILGPEECKPVPVTFQPSVLADVCAEIVITSTQAGQFVFPIIGKSTHPEPRGPYVLTPRTTTTVSVKNVYKSPKTFLFSVDNPSFVLTEREALLKPNEVARIVVGMVEGGIQQFQKYPVTGKLQVTVKDEDSSHVKWVFYLRGQFNTN